MSKLGYQEGDWFGVPLRKGGFALGIVARANPKAALLGFFYGPRRSDCPTIEVVGELDPSDALLIGRFSHLGLTNGRWPILGKVAAWDREKWKMPTFVRYEELTGRSFRVIYDQDDPGRLIREEQISSGLSEQGPKEGLMGAGFVERILTNMLS